jgi:hypothetical protein
MLRNPLFFMVPGDGIEPPTRGFSILLAIVINFVN